MKDRFTDSFIKELHRIIPSRPELVREISRILKIEKEPASRRLSGTVSFSIDEMGILSKELDISLDSLLYKNENYLNIAHQLESPWSKNSINTLIDQISNNLKIINKISNKPYELGSFFNSLPIEIFIHFPNLTKFMLFKWGHFFIGTNEFYNYATWKVPEKFYNVKNQIESWDSNPGKRLYVWDVSLIWIFLKEISYLSELNIISIEDQKIIIDELHSMLTYFEGYIKNIDDTRYQNIETYFYISNVPFGVNGSYLISEAGQIAFSSTHFSQSGLTTDYNGVKLIKDWMLSLIKISTLISNSGHKERHIFFKEQHQLIDYLLKS